MRDHRGRVEAVQVELVVPPLLRALSTTPRARERARVARRRWASASLVGARARCRPLACAAPRHAAAPRARPPPRGRAPSRRPPPSPRSAGAQRPAAEAAGRRRSATAIRSPKRLRQPVVHLACARGLVGDAQAQLPDLGLRRRAGAARQLRDRRPHPHGPRRRSAQDVDSRRPGPARHAGLDGARLARPRRCSSRSSGATRSTCSTPATLGGARRRRCATCRRASPTRGSALVLAVAVGARAGHGLVRRRVPTRSAGAALLAMMAGGLWIIADPAGTVGAVGSSRTRRRSRPRGRGATATRRAPVAALDGGLRRGVRGGDRRAVVLPRVRRRRLVPRPGGARPAAARDRDADRRSTGAAPTLPPRPGPGLVQCAPPAAPSAARCGSARRSRTRARTARCSSRSPPRAAARTRSTTPARCTRAVRRDRRDGCTAPTAPQAEFRTARGTWPRVGGLLLIAAGPLGMLLLLGFLALRLLGAALATLLYLLLAPLAVLAPALGDGGRDTFRLWALRLLGALLAKLVYSVALGVVLLVVALLESLGTLGWWTQWLLVSVFWWTAFAAPPSGCSRVAARARRPRARAPLATGSACVRRALAGHARRRATREAGVRAAWRERSQAPAGAIQAAARRRRRRLAAGAGLPGARRRRSAPSRRARARCRRAAPAGRPPPPAERSRTRRAQPEPCPRCGARRRRQTRDAGAPRPGRGLAARAARERIARSSERETRARRGDARGRRPRGRGAARRLPLAAMPRPAPATRGARARPADYRARLRSASRRSAGSSVAGTARRRRPRGSVAARAGDRPRARRAPRSRDGLAAGAARAAAPGPGRTRRHGAARAPSGAGWAGRSSVSAVVRRVAAAPLPLAAPGEPERSRAR